MAFATIIMKNPHTGKIKNAPVGFSWTSLFFGFFVPLFRGHIKGFVIWAIVQIMTFGISQIFQGFQYNKSYIRYLINEGYKVYSTPVPMDYLTQKLQLTLPVIEEPAV